MATDILSTTKLGDVAPYDPTKPAGLQGYSDLTGGLLAPSTAGSSMQQTGQTAASQLTSASPGIYKASDYTPKENETVAGQMGGLLSQNSQYMQAAKAGSVQDMAARGLINSSMAGEAGQAAAIKSALPIAQQDATYMQNRGITGLQGEISSNLSAQNAGQSSLLSSQEAGQQAGLYGVQGDISSGLSSQAANQQLTQQQQNTTNEYLRASALSEQAAGEKLTTEQYLADQQYKINAALSKQAAGQQLTQQEQNTLNEYQKASALSSQQTGEQAFILGQKAAYDAALSKQQAGQQLTQQEQNTINEYLKASALSGQQTGEQAYLQSQKAAQEQQIEAMRQEGANYRSQIDIASKEKINSLNISSTEKQQMSEKLTAAGRDYEAAMERIMTGDNNSMSAEQRQVAMDTLYTQYYNTTMSTLAAYGQYMSFDEFSAMVIKPTYTDSAA